MNSTMSRVAVPADEADRHPAPSKIDEILGYGGLGLPAFPVSPRTKKPHLKGWQQKAADDGIKLYHLFRHFADANVGLLMGREIRPGEFALALDVDPRHGGKESLRRFLRERRIRLPRTATARTGGGGWHVLLTTPFPTRSRTVAFGPDYPGLDVKAAGGYIVVSPSVHPSTGRAYRWIRHPALGIAAAPKRLLKLLPGYPRRQPTLGAIPPEPAAPPATTGRAAEPARCPPTGGRSAHVPSLTAEIVARFAIPAVGHRWCLMRRAVASLVGRGYGDEPVRAALDGWYDHFHALGRIGTAKPEADRELDVVIRTTRANPDFARSAGEADHAAECRAIELDAELIRRIRELRSVLGKSGEEGEGAAADSKRLTQSSCCDYVIGSSLSGREFAFAEALVVHAIHKTRAGEFARDGVIRMTDRQVVAIARDRHPEVTWVSCQQIERAKRLFIGRPNDNKPAAMFELLREVRKGVRTPGQAVGIPSEYRVTGIVLLLPELGRAAARSPESSPTIPTPTPKEIAP